MGLVGWGGGADHHHLSIGADRYPACVWILEGGWSPRLGGLVVRAATAAARMCARLGSRPPPRGGRSGGGCSGGCSGGGSAGGVPLGGGAVARGGGVRGGGGVGAGSSSDRGSGGAGRRGSGSGASGGDGGCRCCQATRLAPLLAGAAGALTAALGAVGAALLTEAAKPEEWDGEEWAEEGLGMPDMTKEVVVDVRARCAVDDCRNALHSYMKAPPRSTLSPSCDSADAALTIAVFPILADVVEVNTGSRSTAHWRIHFILSNGWLRHSFAQLITFLTLTGSAEIGKAAIE